MSQASKSIAPTYPLSVVNLLGDPLRKSLIRIDADRVMKLAERLTGLHDYGDSDGSFRGRLHETIDAVLETDWNTVGRFGIRYILHWHLGNRLRLVELLKQRPDIEEIEIERFVPGARFAISCWAAGFGERGTPWASFLARFR